MPSALSWIDFNYRASTRSDGQIRAVYSSGRSYAGDITITAGSLTVTLGRISATVWGVTGLSANEVSILRENTWRFGEPGQTGYRINHFWERILSGPPYTVSEDDAVTMAVINGGSTRTSLQLLPDTIAADDGGLLVIDARLTLAAGTGRIEDDGFGGAHGLPAECSGRASLFSQRP